MKSLSVFLIIFLVGCGFHLRGTFIAPEYLKVVRILPDDPYTPLQKSIRTSLIKGGTSIVAANSSNVTTLNLSSANFTNSTLSSNPDGQAERMRRSLTISYSVVTANGKIYNNAASITSSREFITSQIQLLSSDNEVATIDRELVNDVAAKLMRQLTKIHIDHVTLPR
jgi:LPS-assembly lipoprotein